ncbi:MAG TPA: hypothetical protein VGE25_08625 [Sediminibacterium sp.]
MRKNTAFICLLLLLLTSCATVVRPTTSTPAKPAAVPGAATTNQ